MPPLVAAPVGATLVLVALAMVSDRRVLPHWDRQAKSSFALTMFGTGVVWVAGQLVESQLGIVVLVVQLLSLLGTVLVGVAGRSSGRT